MLIQDTYSSRGTSESYGPRLSSRNGYSTRPRWAIRAYSQSSYDEYAGSENRTSTGEQGAQKNPFPAPRRYPTPAGLAGCRPDLFVVLPAPDRFAAGAAADPG